MVSASSLNLVPDRVKPRGALAVIRQVAGGLDKHQAEVPVLGGEHLVAATELQTLAGFSGQLTETQRIKPEPGEFPGREGGGQPVAGGAQFSIQPVRVETVGKLREAAGRLIDPGVSEHCRRLIRILPPGRLPMHLGDTPRVLPKLLRDGLGGGLGNGGVAGLDR